MEFQEVVSRRRSIRRFKKEPIAKPLVEELLSCAIKAPSAGNVQPWFFMVITDPSFKEKLAAAALNQSWMAQAPVIIVVLADLDRAAAAYGERGVHLYALQDTAAAIQNLLLAAVDAGLGGCWVGAFSERQVAAILELPPSKRPVALVPLGYLAVEPRGAAGRRPLREVVSYDY